MNFIDFVIFLAVLALFVSKKNLSFLYCIIVTIWTLTGYTVAVYLALIMVRGASSYNIKGIVTIVLIMFLSIIAYAAGAYFGRRIRTKLLTSPYYKTDRYAGIPAKFGVVIIGALFVAHTLVYIPVLSLQFMAQGSTFLYATNKVFPSFFIGSRMAHLAPNQFEELVLEYDPEELTYDSIVDAGEFQNIILKTSPSVVKISGRSCALVSGMGLGSGSGFIAAPHFIVTNEHVVRGASSVYIRTHEGTYPATPVVLNKDYDIAVLYSKFIRGEPLDVANTIPEIATNVSALGYPGAGDFKYLLGKVIQTPSHLNFNHLKLRNEEVVYASTATMPGNSGGPIINSSGTVVALVSGGGTGNTLAISPILINDMIMKAKNILTPVKTGFCDAHSKTL